MFSLRVLRMEMKVLKVCSPNLNIFEDLCNKKEKRMPLSRASLFCYVETEFTRALH